MTPSEPEARQTRALRKKVNAVITAVVSVFVACAIMMWSVFNAWTNVLIFFANEQPDQAWWITCLLVLLTCVVPFVLAVWLLIRTLSKYQPQSAGAKSAP